MELPSLPIRIDHFIPFVTSRAQEPLTKSLEPFKTFEAKLREVFAQEPDNGHLSDPHVNVLPIFAGHEKDVKVRARDLENETDEVKDQYLLSLPDEDRKPNGAPAIVQSMKEFKTNFNLFSESSLVDLDWSNLVVAGSSVVTSLLPIKAPHEESKRAQREYYHEKLAPASDVDLFLYGLNEEEAIEKIKQIEAKIRDNILHETTTIRTKNAITIVSQYPTRHVQIVLRLYKSVSEILTGFDVDCSCVAYDGSQVWATPRGIAAFMSQINTIDLTRRSPSYENRLSKYSHRGFEVHWPYLDRSRVDPTIFERSFSRVMGLARLLVLEKLPLPADRDNYLAKRRAERGRPPVNMYARYRRELHGNVKDKQPDDVAEWVEEDVSSYHTFTIPYGPKYTAKRIEKLLFTKDLLLNADWNKPREREVDLHRHPAFFGSMNDVIHDCCGFCPTPTTDEEWEVAEDEDKVYIKGDITFMKDDPGRQAIGSFHPITDEDWTAMAYIGSIENLCQAIVDHDLEHVQGWCDQEGADVNRRDHTGRTPLHLATMCSTPEIVECLINHGARLVSRLVDGFTALHIAARRGNVVMVKSILERSEANAEEEERKQEQKRKERHAERAEKKVASQNMDSAEEASEDEEDVMMHDDYDSDSTESHTVTEGSFVKVRGSSLEGQTMPHDDDDEPDVYDVDVLAWDMPLSPLHLAILEGHLDVIELLVKTFGADVLLPVKLVNDYNHSPRTAILALVLASTLPVSEATSTVSKLLDLGASAVQADMDQVSALHYVIAEEAVEVLRILFNFNETVARKAVNHLSLNGGWWRNIDVLSPLLTAIRTGRKDLVNTLLAYGAGTTIDCDHFIESMRRKFERSLPDDPETNKSIFQTSVDQPVIAAAESDLPEVVRDLLDRGADPNTINKTAYILLENPNHTWHGPGNSLLDVIDARLKKLKAWAGKKTIEESKKLEADETYLAGLEPGSYKYWLAKRDLMQAKEVQRQLQNAYENDTKDTFGSEEGGTEKKQAIDQVIADFEELKTYVESKGAKSFYELYPKMTPPTEQTARRYHRPIYGGSSRDVDAPYQTTFHFQVPDLNEVKKEGYLNLFQAAWDGDLHKIKELTLGQWGEQENRPLQIAVTDGRGNSPFAIAVYRRHLNVAKAIVEIAIAQFEPAENGRHQYTLATYHSEYGTDSEDENSINIEGELIDDRFTIEDIGAIGDKVKSNVSPKAMLNWRTQIWRFLPSPPSTKSKRAMGTTKSRNNIYWHDADSWGWPYFHEWFDNELQNGQGSLLRWAIHMDELKLVQFLLDLGQDLVERDRKSFGTSTVFSVDAVDFDYAISLGRRAILSEIIKRTGAAMPLEMLVEKSGIEPQGKPKFYQGLSVYGQERKDWADAGRGMSLRPAESQQPPLLNAAFKGSLESTEFFLSEEPLRRYKDFASSHEDDERLKLLFQSSGGIQKALESWLNARINLALHCAVMAKPAKPPNTDLVELVLRNLPGALDSTNVHGLTPLLLGFSLRRISACRVLVDAGANHLVRDAHGKNVLHHILVSVSGTPLNDQLVFSELLQLIDPNAIQPMLLERCGAGPGATTPLSLWLYQGGKSSEVLQVILSHSKGKDLEIMNGAGDFPLHQLMDSTKRQVVQTMLNFNPALLHRENAVGMTPLEMLSNRRLRWHIENPPSVFSAAVSHTEERAASSFVKRDEETPDIFSVCEQTATARPGKRKLASLYDANEVAKRLASQQRRGGVSPNAVLQESDEVSQWMGQAVKFNNSELKQLSEKAATSPPSSQENEEDDDDT